MTIDRLGMRKEFNQWKKNLADRNLVLKQERKQLEKDKWIPLVQVGDIKLKNKIMKTLRRGEFKAQEFIETTSSGNMGCVINIFGKPRDVMDAKEWLDDKYDLNLRNAPGLPWIDDFLSESDY